VRQHRTKNVMGFGEGDNEGPCLLGIFGINIAMLYGEGEMAFIGLQEESMKISDDHSLFAWKSLDNRGGLLATSPGAFRTSNKVIPLNPSSTLDGTITVNNKGIYLKLRLVDRPSERDEFAILPCIVEGQKEKEIAILVKYIPRTRIFL
jgi:hypothetical protein